MSEKAKKAEEKKAPLKGQATPEQIAEWRKKYPLGLYPIEIDGSVCYFKFPGFEEIDAYDEEISAAMEAGDKPKRSERAKKFLDLLYVGGDQELIDGQKYRFVTHAILQGELEKIQGKLGNL